MSNDYFNEDGTPPQNAAGTTAQFRAVNTSIRQGFDKLCPLAGNGGKTIKVKADGSAQEPSKVTITEPATGATLTIPNGVTFTGPAASGTAATLAGTETLTNKTLTSPALGTPASGDLANCTFPTLNQNTNGNAATVTTNANLTGHVTSVGNAAVLGSFTMAQLNAAISDGDVALLAGSASQDFAVNTLTTSNDVNSSKNFAGTTAISVNNIDAAGAATVYSQSNAGIVQMQISNTASGGLSNLYSSASGGHYTYTVGATPLRFGTNSTENARFQGGLFGINTITPGLPLDVQANGNGQAVLLTGRSSDNWSQLFFGSYDSVNYYSTIGSAVGYLAFGVGTTTAPTVPTEIMRLTDAALFVGGTTVAGATKPVHSSNTCKAFGSCGVAGNLNANSYNISSITDTATGIATVNFTTAMAATTYCVIATIQQATGANEIASCSSKSTTSFVIFSCTGESGTVLDPGIGYNFAVFGN